MHVLVAIDELDASARHHLEVGRQLAQAFGGGLLAFHACAAPDVEEATRDLTEIVRNVAAVDVAPYGEPGRGAAIADAAERHQCDLIVMGTQGLDPFVGRFLDSPAHKVLEVGRCPVLVVHPERGFRQSGRRVVMIAMADPVFSVRALQHGLNLAKALQAVVKIVHVGSREEDPVATLLRQQGAHPSQVMVAEAAAEFNRTGVEAEGQVIPNYSGMADELAQAADRLDADVIVIGSSGKLDLGEWLLGSIAEAVLHRSQRTVLVVPSLTL
jgi:nucleotide-binding universal stress UspA family protein